MSRNQRPLHVLIRHDLYAVLNTKAHTLEVSKAHIVRAALRKYLLSTPTTQIGVDVEEDVADTYRDE